VKIQFLKLKEESGPLLLKAAPAKSVQILASGIDAISSSIHRHKTEVAVMVARVRLGTDPNNSAVDVYTLHTLLRQRLGRMTRDRKLKLEVREAIANKLRHLRSFNENLFTGFKAPSHCYFKVKLLELQRQPSLITYRPATQIRRVVATTDLPTEAKEKLWQEINGWLGAARVIEKEPIAKLQVFSFELATAQSRHSLLNSSAGSKE
jgi:hypothetical protein